MKLVSCTPEYWEFVRVLRTDPRTSTGFIQQVQISKEQQHKYMTEHAHEYFVALADGQPVGFVGCVDNDIRVCTHPDFQGRGIGSLMVRELAKLVPNCVAKVKANNQAGNALFRSLGYVPTFTIYERPKQGC